MAFFLIRYVTLNNVIMILSWLHPLLMLILQLVVMITLCSYSNVLHYEVCTTDIIKPFTSVHPVCDYNYWFGSKGLNIVSKLYISYNINWMEPN